VLHGALKGLPGGFWKISKNSTQFQKTREKNERYNFPNLDFVLPISTIVNLDDSKTHFSSPSPFPHINRLLEPLVTLFFSTQS